jgi:hypothetical protein
MGTRLVTLVLIDPEISITSRWIAFGGGVRREELSVEWVQGMIHHFNRVQMLMNNVAGGAAGRKLIYILKRRCIEIESERRGQTPV